MTNYDSNGNVLSYTDTVMGSWSFGYDQLNRLVTAANTASAPATTPAAPAPNWAPYFCWAYDGFGNRLQQSTSNASFTTGDGSCTFNGAQYQNVLASYNTQNQITQTNAPGVSYNPTYDAAADVANDFSHAYLYDAEGRICAEGNGSSGYGYLYDASGNRVAKGYIRSWSCDVTTNGFMPMSGYVVGPSGEQLTEVVLNNGNAWEHTNVYANGKLIGTYDSLGQHFHFDDPLGTRRAQASASGTLEAVYESLPFGDDLVSAGSAEDPTENHFTGKERDAESGNDYFGARYYASTMGRWMSPDWSAKEEPVPYAKLDNPQSLNLYGYVLNNPLSHADPDGHQEEDAEGEGEVAAARNARSGLRPMSLAEAEQAARMQRPLTPEQQAFNERYILGSGGRFGSNTTRRLNGSLADTFSDAGFKVLGGTYDSEEFIKGTGPGNKGGTFVDLTVTDGKQVIRIQTVDLTAKGELTPAEASAAARIQAKFPNDKLILVAITPYRRPASSDPVQQPVKVR